MLRASDILREASRVVGDVAEETKFLDLQTLSLTISIGKGAAALMRLG